jgi:hypothetical protein
MRVAQARAGTGLGLSKLDTQAIKQREAMTGIQGEEQAPRSKRVKVPETPHQRQVGQLALSEPYPEKPPPEGVNPRDEG